LHYSFPSTAFWKGAHREYWRDGKQQKLFDLDGAVDRGVDGAAARTGRKLTLSVKRLASKSALALIQGSKESPVNRA
jgi:hypothetical protein